MTAQPTSRYADLPTVAVPAPDGTTRVLRVPRVVPAVPVAGGYQVHPGDRLDLLGHLLVGDSTGWWRIADANPWADPTRLEQPGRTVELPDA